MQLTAANNDWVTDRIKRFWLWWLPTILLFSVLYLEHPFSTWIWTICLIWKGTACVFNARRCGRHHCFYTGPFYLLMALVGFLHGYQIIWFGPNGWIWLIIALFVIGWGVLWLLIEKVWGTYKQTTATKARSS